jgi:sec-independent protein translocase protein TatA
MRLGTTEIILIIVLALVLFGGGKLAGVGKALGKSIKDFKNEVKDDDSDGKKDQPEEKKDNPDSQEKA